MTSAASQQPALRLAVAAIALAGLLATGCSYRLAKPPQLGESVRVVVTANNARLVRSQAYLQAAVARALQNRLGWRVDPLGSARLELVILEEDIGTTGTDSRDLPARWKIVVHGHAALHSRRAPLVGPFTGNGFASGLSEEPEAIQRAANNAAAQIAGWLEAAGKDWD